MLSFRHYKICGLISPQAVSDSVKGTGTRDLIWLKVVSLDRSWLVPRAHGRHLKIFKMLLYNFNKFLKKFSGTGKTYAYCK